MSLTPVTTPVGSDTPNVQLNTLLQECAATNPPKVLLREWRGLLQAAGLKVYKNYAEAGIFPQASTTAKTTTTSSAAEASYSSPPFSSNNAKTAAALSGAVAGPDDLLFIIDMQNDFLPPKGSFGVAEGNSATHAILSKYMLKDFLNNPVYLSRDYHPVDHCSFQNHNGPFPTHCVQGTWGAYFDESIAKAITVRRHIRHEQKIKRVHELDKLENVHGVAISRHSESRNYQAYLSATTTNSLSSVGAGSNDDQSDFPDESISSPPPQDGSGVTSPNNCGSTPFMMNKDGICESILLEPAVGETKVVFKGFSPDIDSFGAAPYAESDHHASASTRLSLRPADLHHSTGCEHLGEAGTPMTAMRREDTTFATVETHSTPVGRGPDGFPNDEDFNVDDAASIGRESASRSVHTRKNFCSPAWTGAFILRSSNEPQDVNAPPDVMSVLNKREVLKDVENLFHRRHRDRGIVNRALRPDSRKNPQLPNAFICGLALDFCVVDTAINVSRHCHEFFGNVCILLDGCRAAHIPGLGQYGSGFMTDPAKFVAWVNGANVKVIDLSLGEEEEEELRLKEQC